MNDDNPVLQSPIGYCKLGEETFENGYPLDFKDGVLRLKGVERPHTVPWGWSSVDLRPKEGLQKRE